jgi:choline dehydrogenase-like flavoprotein
MSPVVHETMNGPLGKDVRWVYKHFPLRSHPWAEPAAVASECARQIGGNDAFWQIHDAYFAEQEGFTADNHRERVLTWVRKQGLPAARFEKYRRLLSYSGNTFTRNWVVNEKEHPTTGTRYAWVRTRVLGGKTNFWGRVALRLSDYDFKAASRDGFGDDWPIGYPALAQ